MYNKFLLHLCLLPLVLGACNATTKPSEQPTLLTGIWRAELELQGQKLPFTFEVNQADSMGYEVYLINGQERLRIDDVLVQNDSLNMPMSFFDTQIRARVDEGKLSGTFIKNYAEDYRLSFSATHGEDYRFVQSSNQEAEDFGGKWEVQFEEDSLISVGIFEQQRNQVTGSFLTTTGDYRFLEGDVEGSTMKLSTFDGEHAYLFEARMQEDGSLEGDYWSGKTHHTTWTAKRNEQAELPDANTLTYLKEGYDKLAFTFPNLEGEPVSLSDEKYQGKVVIVQLFGTWCPNCMDETIFFADWYRRHQDEEVEIIGLAYERKDDFAYASSRVKKMIGKLDVGYDFLIAGVSDKEAAAKTLPMLNRVMSFPTSIFIDKNGQVRNIHTGFSGPGTGVYYERFVEEFNLLMDKLLAEEVSS
ncbi:TlpA disulfide reductase family protein [Catalinimonas niigatensis]|uniref:TlpA disulfide reductase family protein n=1 Tax=Catalinimonas niigatensis TaxID=1397264 RepID=UPI002664EF14|nr:TlpA disulfide reductase family protein [Catalinimonas niigatensis]WPP53183.1 TlpA disulfide reductase family protein [Catalinimonas niigatensis]